MKEVPLINSEEVAVVDDADFDLVSQYQWKLVVSHGGKRIKYAHRHGDNLPMHDLVLPHLSGFVSDHIDFDGLNNRRSNLRVITPQHNSLHRRMHSNNKSGYRGVHRTEHGKWVASISHLGKSHRLGQFECPEEAARAFDAAAMELRGAMAELNFPKKGKAA